MSDKHADYYVRGRFKGEIVLWSGSVASIPEGWQLCDGTNGTPNLRDRFVVGAGGTYAVGGTGGATFHSHTVGAGKQLLTGAEVAIQTTGHLPPYYALCYIMRMI